jgi:hypothetical protein
MVLQEAPSIYMCRDCTGEYQASNGSFFVIARIFIAQTVKVSPPIGHSIQKYARHAKKHFV